MEIVGMVHDMATWLTQVTHWADILQADNLQAIQAWSLELAEIKNKIPETDLVGDLSKAFDHFVKTGQAWAFLIGLVMGYVIRTFTSFG